jgi:hypothetical protein
MDEEEFKLFADNAVDELEAKQDSLETEYKLGLSSRWEFDGDTAALRFYNRQDSLILSCGTFEIGTFSPETLTWLWAWGNQWLPPKLKERTLALKELQEITGRAFFGLHVPFSANEDLAWRLAAISVRHLSSLGCFKAPVRDGRVHAFLALETVDAASA